MSQTRPVPQEGAREWPATFADRLTTPLPRLRDVFTVARQGGFRGADPADAARVPVGPGRLPQVGTGQTGVTWIGHATYVLQTGGLTVLTDPVWSRRIPGVRPRLIPPGVAWADLPPIDAVVISHNHYDHLDAPTIQRLPCDTPILVPGALGRWFWKRGFTRVTELDWGEAATIEGVRFEFVPAHHWSRRSLFDTCRTLWGGWLISADARIYFAGDTAYGYRFTEIGRRYPDIDLALMPVGAYEPRWFMAGQHVNPAEAVRACDDVRATRMAPMHWGTFMLSAEPLLAPLDEARTAWREAGREASDLWDLAVGEGRVLP